MKRTTALIALAAISLIGAPAMAQDGPGGRRGQFGQAQRIAPEKAEAIWTLEAKSVSSRLGLDDAQTAKIIEAYVAARTSHGKALREQREKMRELRSAGRDDDGGGNALGGDDREARRERAEAMREAMQAMAKTEREKLAKSLGAVLAGEQLAYASDVLGSFNGQWDRLVNIVTGFDSDEEKTMAALAPIEQYVATTTKLRATGDRSSMREAMGEAREELHASLSYVLTEPQVEKVLASMQRGGRRGPGGGAADGRGRGRGAGGDGAADGRGRGRGRGTGGDGA